MKTIKLSTDTLHYRFAKIYGTGYIFQYGYDQFDLCTYGKAVAVGIVRCLLLTFVLVVFAGLLPAPMIGWLVAMGAMQQWIQPDGPAMLLPYIIGCFAFAIAVMTGPPVLYKAVQNLLPRVNTQVERPPNAWVLWYRSFKEKTCVLVRFD